MGYFWNSPFLISKITVFTPGIGIGLGIQYEERAVVSSKSKWIDANSVRSVCQERGGVTNEKRPMEPEVLAKKLGPLGSSVPCMFNYYHFLSALLFGPICLW